MLTVDLFCKLYKEVDVLGIVAELLGVRVNCLVVVFGCIFNGTVGVIVVDSGMVVVVGGVLIVVRVIVGDLIIVDNFIDDVVVGGIVSVVFVDIFGCIV